MRRSGARKSLLLKADSAAYRNFIARTSTPSINLIKVYRYLLNSLTAKGFIDESGTSTKLNFLYYLSADSTTNALLNLISTSFTATNSGCTFTAGRGYTGDGVAAFLDTNFNPSTNGGTIYAQDSACQGMYILNNRTADAATNNMGTVGAATQNRLIAKNGGTFVYGINHSVAVDTITNSTAQGSYVTSRTSSTLTTVYKNGASIATGTTVSAARDNATMYILNADLVGTGPLAGSADEMSAAWAGSGWNSADALMFQDILNQCQRMQGINVY